MVCALVRVGSAWVHMFDGVVHTLTEVRHVSNLKKNLILLRVFDSRDHQCTLEGGALIGCRGAQVALHEHMVNDLYRLVRRVDLGVARASVSEVSDIDQWRT